MSQTIEFFDCEQDPTPTREDVILPAPDEVLHQAIDMIRASVEARTKAVHETMASLDRAVRLLESYEEALRRLGGDSKPKPQRKTSIPRRERSHKTSRSPLGLTPNGQTVYDALPKDGAVVDLKHLSEVTGLDLRVVAVSASHLSRHHGHLVRRMGTSTYRRRHAVIDTEFEVSDG